MNDDDGELSAAAETFSNPDEASTEAYISVASAEPDVISG